MGTKFDHLVNFPREDQEEITKQVSTPLISLTTGSTICTRDEGKSHLLLHKSFHQCSKSIPSQTVTDADLQNCLVESVRPEMYYSRDIGCGRTDIRVHERIIFVGIALFYLAYAVLGSSFIYASQIGVGNIGSK